jgi:RimJ/RimL family protein N-acetyltransferase
MTTLETPRLFLRPPIADDFEPWAAMMQDEEVARHLGGTMPRSMVWRSMATMIGAWTLRGFSMFSAIEKQSGQWIGRLGPWQPEGWPGSEIGWAIKRSHWGQGLALEGAQACLAYAFEQLGWDQAIHCIAPDNGRSIRLAERLGSTYWRTERLPPPLERHEVKIFGQSRHRG